MTPAAWRALGAIAAASAATELATAAVGSYGYFIDELYYIACARHLAWGYIDHPPLAVWLLSPVLSTLGSSLVAIRLLPALAGGATVLLAGRLAARLGAPTSAQVLAGTLTWLSPILLVLFGVYTTNAVDILLWVVALSLLLELELGGSPRLWLVLGAALGLAQMTKHTSFVLALAVGVGTLATPIRRHLKSRWPWMGAAIAVLLVLPNMLWEIRHDWITLEFARNAVLHKNFSRAPAEVLWQQVIFNNPGAVVFWVGGLALLLSGRAASVSSEPGTSSSAGRAMGLVYVSLLIIMMASGQSRPDRIVAMQPVLLAAGCVLWARFTRFRGGRWLRAFIAVGAIVPALVVAPLFLPVLPPALAAQWNATLGLDVRVERGAGKAADLPQWLADRVGWEEFVADTARAVARADAILTREKRRSLIIVTNSYGHAGALELMGGPDLPPVYATHNNYILWGPPPQPVDAVIVIDDGPERLSEVFEHVELLDIHDCDHCVSWRDQMPIWLVWGPRVDLRARWMELRHLE